MCDCDSKFDESTLLDIKLKTNITCEPNFTFFSSYSVSYCVLIIYSAFEKLVYLVHKPVLYILFAWNLVCLRAFKLKWKLLENDFFFILNQNNVPTIKYLKDLKYLSKKHKFLNFICKKNRILVSVVMKFSRTYDFQSKIDFYEKKNLSIFRLPWIFFLTFNHFFKHWKHLTDELASF
jgi:hypothetical protein